MRLVKFNRLYVQNIIDVVMYQDITFRYIMCMNENIVKIPVLDGEVGEIIEMEIGEDCLKEMDRIQEEYEQKRKEISRHERELERYDRE